LINSHWACHPSSGRRSSSKCSTYITSRAPFAPEAFAE
jgi:hypothetical protein